ncbi:glycosyltransferase family 2 protein [Zafaria sp. Z1313]|uniref:glycosyltransferase family 2 protein n=1 Tax=unclassified Zafaria TaxID=2828765 RepID=UPI002E77DCCF|nr:glycosyltransferase family 2 protein [Zafaria sp. J156]MEE1619947.1 glycosyltransferase family 2 protein [Zafaria sp. J156]
MQRPGRVPRVRPVQRRALRNLGRPVGARAAPVAEASSLIHSQVRVTAVLVAHNGARYLPGTLEALNGQSRPADVCIGVDAGSSDASGALLRAGLPQGSPVVEAASQGFGHSVATGLQGRLPAADPEIQDWIWLLHDDAAPDPYALESLLRSVETTPSVTIAGCKQLDRDAPRRLLDAGLTVSRWGERLTLIDVDELDQGQYDRRSDSFAVNSAGMLVRRDAWEQLGGFDPALPGHGDDLDLCWRNRLAGHRVVVVPQARMYHSADTIKSMAGPVAARRAEVYLRLKHARAWQLPFVALGAVLGGVLRFFASLVAKDPGHALGQLGASLAAVLSPLRLARSRRAARRTRRVSRSMVRILMVPRREVWAHRRNLLEGLEATRVVGDGTGSTSEASNPSGDNNDDFAALAAPARTSDAVSAVLVVLIAGTAALIGLRSLVNAPALTGGSLLPLSPGLGDIWHHATAWWQGAGGGQPGPGDPFDHVLWLVGAAGLGNANAAFVVLFLAAMPLAALGAWTALGAVTGSRAARLVGALLWALAPALQSALGGGRAGAVAVHVVLPWVVLGCIRAVGAARERRTGDDAGAGPPRAGVRSVPSWAAAAGAGLGLAACTAGSPALLPFAVVATVLVALPLGRRAKTLWWVPVPALVLAAGHLVAAAEQPRILLADPGVPQAFEAAPLWQQLLGFPTAFDAAAPLAGFGWLPAEVPGALTAAIAIGAPVLLLAAVGLFRPGPRGWTARTLWTVGVLALAAGVASGLVPTAVDAGTPVSAFTGPFVSVFTLAAVFAAVVGLDGLRRLHRDARANHEPGAPRGRGRTAAFAAAMALLLAATAASTALWLVPGLATGEAVADAAGDGAATPERLGTALEVVPGAARTLPATAADRGTGPFEDRSLVIGRGDDGMMTASLMDGAGTSLDGLAAIVDVGRFHGGLVDAEPRQDDDVTALVRSTVASIVSGQSIDPRQALQELGVSFVVLRPGDAATDALAGQLDSVPGLGAVGRTESGWLWRVEPAAGLEGTDNPADFTARVRIVDAGGATVRLVPSERAQVSGHDVPAGAEGRLVVLAERSDPGWRARFNGEPLPPAGTGWAQAFELPAGPGTLEIRYDSAWTVPVLAAQGTVLGMALLLLVPIPQRRRFAVRRLEQYRSTSSADSIRELDAGGSGDPTADSAADGGEGSGRDTAAGGHGEAAAGGHAAEAGAADADDAAAPEPAGGPEPENHQEAAR